jgi:D-beta-D-heptose 7-phosphate kinase/D-beta-D-heptose 1-phosphate adenosyltransferase
MQGKHATVCTLDKLTPGFFDQDTPLELIRRVRPKVLAKGGDYRRDEVVGHELVESGGGEVILVDLMPGFSTSKIVRRSRVPASVRGS